LVVKGDEAITVFHAIIEGRQSSAERRFCSRCGSALWAWDPGWPELVHPFASAIDTPLPEAPEVVQIMLGSKPTWVRVDDAGSEACHKLYPSESLEEWHQRHGLIDDD